MTRPPKDNKREPPPRRWSQPTDDVEARSWTPVRKATIRELDQAIISFLSSAPDGHTPAEIVSELRIRRTLANETEVVGRLTVMRAVGRVFQSEQKWILSIFSRTRSTQPIANQEDDMPRNDSPEAQERNRQVLAAIADAETRGGLTGQELLDLPALRSIPTPQGRAAVATAFIRTGRVYRSPEGNLLPGPAPAEPGEPAAAPSPIPPVDEPVVSPTAPVKTLGDEFPFLLAEADTQIADLPVELTATVQRLRDQNITQFGQLAEMTDAMLLTMARFGDDLHADLRVALEAYAEAEPEEPLAAPEEPAEGGAITTEELAAAPTPSEEELLAATEVLRSPAEATVGTPLGQLLANAVAKFEGRQNEVTTQTDRELANVVGKIDQEDNSRGVPGLAVHVPAEETAAAAAARPTNMVSAMLLEASQQFDQLFHDNVRLEQEVGRLNNLLTRPLKVTLRNSRTTEEVTLEVTPGDGLQLTVAYSLST